MTLDSLVPQPFGETEVGGAWLGSNPAATDDIADDAITPAKVQPGTNGQVLTTVGGDVAWAETAAPAVTVENRQEIVLGARGLIAENFDIAQVGTSSALTSGRIYFGLIGLLEGEVVTNVVLDVETGGAGTVPTRMEVGLYLWPPPETSAALVATSGNNATVIIDIDPVTNPLWATSGSLTEFPLSTPYTVTETAAYYLAVLQVGTWGTTQLALGRGTTMTANASSPVFSAGAARTGIRSSQTSLPATSFMLTTTLHFWMGCN